MIGDSSIAQPSAAATALALTAGLETFPHDSYSLALWLDKALALDRPSPSQTEVERQLREGLERYGRHDGLCGIVGGYGRCTCGLDAILDTHAMPGDGA